MRNTKTLTDREIQQMRNQYANILKPTSFNKSVLEASSKNVTAKDREMVQKAGMRAMEELQKNGMISSFG
jgi:hypothetical protein